MHFEDMAEANIIGRLTRDMELGYTNSGIAIGKFTIVVNKSKKINDVWEKIPHYFDCVVWNKDAEGLQKELLKGVKVSIKADINQDRWEQDGKKRSKITFTAIRVLSASKKNVATEESIDDVSDPIPF